MAHIISQDSCYILNPYFSGHEIHGLEYLPDEGSALLIFYHGVVPIDYYYVMSKCLIEKQRQLHAVGDNFLFNIPGKYHERKNREKISEAHEIIAKIILKVAHCGFTIQECVQKMQKEWQMM